MLKAICTFNKWRNVSFMHSNTDKSLFKKFTRLNIQWRVHLLLKEYVQEKNDFQAFIFLFKEQVLLVKCAGNEFFISLTLIGVFLFGEWLVSKSIYTNL